MHAVVRQSERRDVRPDQRDVVNPFQPYARAQVAGDEPNVDNGDGGVRFNGEEARSEQKGGGQNEGARELTGSQKMCSGRPERARRRRI